MLTCWDYVTRCAIAYLSEIKVPEHTQTVSHHSIGKQGQVDCQNVYSGFSFSVFLFFSSFFHAWFVPARRLPQIPWGYFWRWEGGAPPGPAGRKRAGRRTEEERGEEQYFKGKERGSVWWNEMWSVPSLRACRHVKDLKKLVRGEVGPAFVRSCRGRGRLRDLLLRSSLF